MDSIPRVPLRQDEDVLDTWFSSALWPFSTQGWPRDTHDLRTYYPTSVLVTGFDIIFFWVARMIMMGLKFTAEVPFHEVYVHGLIRDHDGQKMSKSKGNVIDPLDIVDGITFDALIAKRTSGLMQPQMKPAIEKATRKQFPQGIPAFGTDALRLTFASLATQSRDLRFDMAKVEGNRNFCNKLWNAARYVLMNVEGRDLPLRQGETHLRDTHGVEFSLADRWIRTRLAAMLARVESGFRDYRLDTVANALYEFTWSEFCDWYVEFSKAVLQSDAASEAAKRGTRCTLIDTLEVLLRALHPVAPFISEEIWQRVRSSAGVDGESIMLRPFPRAEDIPADAGAEAEMRWVMNFILGVRQIRGEMDIAPSRKLEVLLQNAGERDIEYLRRNRSYLIRLAGIEHPRVLAPEEPAPIAAVALLGTLEILVPMAGLIDPEAELERSGQATASRGDRVRINCKPNWRTRSSRRMHRRRWSPKINCACLRCAWKSTNWRRRWHGSIGCVADERALYDRIALRRRRSPRPAQPRDLGQGCADSLVPRMSLGARTFADRRHSRCRQDDPRARYREDARTVLPARAIHQRSAARRRAGRLDLRSRDRKIPLSARPHLCTARARRRDQPSVAQGAKRAAGSDGGAASDPRRAIHAVA